MGDHPHRTAQAVFGRKLTSHTPPSCPVCPLPFRPTDLVTVTDQGPAHAFCAEV